MADGTNAISEFIYGMCVHVCSTYMGDFSVIDDSLQLLSVCSAFKVHGPPTCADANHRLSLAVQLCLYEMNLRG